MTSNHGEPDVMQGPPGGDSEAYVQYQVTRWREGEPVVNTESAQIIASWWHSANGDGFSAFSHTGKVTNRLLDSIDREARAYVGLLQSQFPVGLLTGTVTMDEYLGNADALNALHALRAYVKAIPHNDYPHGPGRLPDCPACERECYCGDLTRETECVHCGLD